MLSPTPPCPPPSRFAGGEKRAKQRSQSQIIKTRGEVKGRQGSKIYADPPVRSNASKKKGCFAAKLGEGFPLPFTIWMYIYIHHIVKGRGQMRLS